MRTRSYPRKRSRSHIAQTRHRSWDYSVVVGLQRIAVQQRPLATFKWPCNHNVDAGLSRHLTHWSLSTIQTQALLKRFLCFFGTVAGLVTCSHCQRLESFCCSTISVEIRSAVAVFEGGLLVRPYTSNVIGLLLSIDNSQVDTASLGVLVPSRHRVD
jgi:hypothetical protein